MRLDWANVSEQELWWTAPAVLALMVTVLMIGWARRSFAIIRAKVRAEPARYRSWGPRWNFSLLLLAALICFGTGWLGYLAVGVLAILTPPPIADVNRTASAWFAWLLIGMEVTHAVAQGLLWSALRSLAGEPIIPHVWPLRAHRAEHVDTAAPAGGPPP